MKIRERKNYFAELHKIDQLSRDLVIRQTNTTMHFEKIYKELKKNRRTTIQHLIYAIVSILFIVILFYKYFGNLYVKIFLVILGLCFIILLFRFFEANKKYQALKKEWNFEFENDNKTKEIIREEKIKLANIALKIIVYSENYLYLSQFHNLDEKDFEFKKLISLYWDSLDNLQTYEDILAYFNEWENNNP